MTDELWQEFMTVAQKWVLYVQIYNLPLFQFWHCQSRSANPSARSNHYSFLLKSVLEMAQLSPPKCLISIYT